MKTLKYIPIAVFLMIFAIPANAEVLKGKKLRKAVTGKTIYLSMSMGIVLPIKYRPGGTMLGKLNGLASIIPSNIPKKDRGRWWIAKDRLCQTWNKWLKKKSYCYSLKRVNGQVHWHRNDGASGTARIASH